MAIGAHVEDPSLGLRIFEGATPEVLEKAEELKGCRGLVVEVDNHRAELLIDVTVVREGTTGRAVLEREHSRLVRLEQDGRLVGGEARGPRAASTEIPRRQLEGRPLPELMDLARSATREDRARLREGAVLNLGMAWKGLSLLPPGFASPAGQDTQTRLSRLVSAGVFARMSGEALTVMTLAGSGNKGITVAVPLTLRGRELGLSEEHIDEALAFACLMTSLTTHHLGTLSALCGAAIASGIGVASGLVLLEGGDADQVDLAVNTMVGNVAGMICDGAKIGCAMKTMTGVDAAFRAANLALAGIGVPFTDGIVGRDGLDSLRNLGSLAVHGMVGVDTEILRIMQQKLDEAPSGPDPSSATDVHEPGA